MTRNSHAPDANGTAIWLDAIEEIEAIVPPIAMSAILADVSTGFVVLSIVQ